MCDAVDKANAIGVVNLVLQHPRQKGVGRFDVDAVAVDVGGAHAHLGVAWHFAVNVFNGEATLLVVFNFALVLNNFGVDEYGKIVVVFVVKIFADDNHARHLVNLHRC